MDVTLLVLIFVDLYSIETTYKGTLYATKLKLELPILNQLRNLVKRNTCQYCNSFVFSAFSFPKEDGKAQAEKLQWSDTNSTLQLFSMNEAEKSTEIHSVSHDEIISTTEVS